MQLAHVIEKFVDPTDKLLGAQSWRSPISQRVRPVTLPSYHAMSDYFLTVYANMEKRHDRR